MQIENDGIDKSVFDERIHYIIIFVSDSSIIKRNEVTFDFAKVCYSYALFIHHRGTCLHRIGALSLECGRILI